MTYLLEIQGTAESKSLVESLKTLKYVKMKSVSKNFRGEKGTIREISKSGKSVRGYWTYTKKQVAASV